MLLSIMEVLPRSSSNLQQQDLCEFEGTPSLRMVVRTGSVVNNDALHSQDLNVCDFEENQSRQAEPYTLLKNPTECPVPGGLMDFYTSKAERQYADNCGFDQQGSRQIKHHTLLRPQSIEPAQHQKFLGDLREEELLARITLKHAGNNGSEMVPGGHRHSEIYGAASIDPAKPNIYNMMQPKKQTPSFTSKGSGTSSYRHSLLKTSTKTMQSADPGLPVQPVLATPAVLPVVANTASTSSICRAEDSLRNTPVRSIAKALGQTDALEETTFTHSDGKDQSSSVLHRTGSASVNDLTLDAHIHKDSSYPQSHNMLSLSEAEWTSVSGLESIAALGAFVVINNKSVANTLLQTRAPELLPTMSSTTLRSSGTLMDMENEMKPSLTQAACLGTVPSVQKAVEDNFQAVVCKAVQNISMPSDYNKTEAHLAYRKLMVGPLTEAVQTANALLRRDSIWEIEAANAAEEWLRRASILEETSEKTNYKLMPEEPGKDKRLSIALEPFDMDCYVPLVSLTKKDETLASERPLEKKCDGTDSGKSLHDNPNPLPHIREAFNLHGKSGFKARGNKLVETLASSMNPSHTASPTVPGVSPPKSSKGAEKLKYAFKNVLHSRPASNMKTFLPGQAPARRSSLSLQKKFDDNGSQKPGPPLEHLEVAEVQPNQHRPADMLAGRAVERLRYISPLKPQNSGTSARFRDLVKPSVDAPQVSRASISDEMRSLSSEDSDPYRTVRWLREILYSSEPHAPRLTALPPRTRVQPRKESGIPRASTAPSGSVDQLYLGATPGAPEPETSRLVDNFNKTIEDLELLLGEALEIARGAAGQDCSQQLPDILTDAASILLRGREDFITGSVQSRQVMSNAIRSSPRVQASEAASLVGIRGKLGSRTSSVTESENSMTQDDNGASSDDILQDYHQSLQDMTVRSYNRRTEDLSSAIQQTPVAAPRVIPTGGGFLPGESPIMIVPAARNVTAAAAFISIPEFKSHDDAFMQQRHSNTDDFRKASFPLSANTAEKPMPRTAARVTKPPYVESEPGQIRPKNGDDALPNKGEVENFIRVFHNPPIQPRMSSLALCKRSNGAASNRDPVNMGRSSTIEIFPRTTDPDAWTISTIHSLDGPTSHGSTDEMDFSTQTGVRTHGQFNSPIGRGSYKMQDVTEPRIGLVQRKSPVQRLQDKAHHLSLRGRSHVSITKFKGFSLGRSHKRQPIARDWSPIRKRFVATVACISTALIGILIGIYAGEVPSIQYYIADMNHYAVLGNVFFYIGLAIPTIFLWPLPLLHGRKPYVLSAMTIAMPLLFPQALTISLQRSPYVSTFRIGLILPRAFMGFALGFAQMNFMSTLMDLFGASLQSGNPHQEIVDEYDVRRHGGGMGVWLGIWTWCYIGSIGVGFLIGAWIINTLSPDWGLYVSIILIAAVLLLNVITPEVRRSAYRRSVVEVRTKTEVSRRLARGELKMHRTQTGPTWWAQEVHHGIVLTFDMLRQPGFLVLALYLSWIYGQIVLITVLLSSLMSNYYRFASPIVGVTTLAIPIGAVLAIPFQKASLLSRARHHPQRTNSMTFEKRVSWSSHLIRRSIFTLVLPFAGLAYTLSSGGPPTPFILPVLFAGLMGFLSNLAIAECNGIIMEVFDTSDLQPGMTGRPRGSSGEKTKHKRTNYSSFPRVSAAFAIVQGLGFLIAALATGIGGVAQRHIGQQAATSVMAGILLILTLLLLSCLLRWKEVQVIPSIKAAEMEIYEGQRIDSIKKMEERRKSGQWDSARVVKEREDEEEQWRPTVIGNPSGKTRRMSILELGHLTRWSEIRRKNRLIDEASYEAHHPNLAALDSVRRKLESKGSVRSGTKSTKKRNRPVLATAHSFESGISTRSTLEMGNTQNGDLGSGSKQLMHEERV